MGKAKKLLNLLACLILGATAVGVAGCDFLPQGNSQAEQSSLMNQINGITSSVEESQSDSTIEDVHEHAWDEGQITTEAGCGTEGVKTYSCTCGETYTEKVDALEHSYTDYHSNEDATCEEDGTKTALCDNGCGTTDTITDENSALGHNF